MDSHEAGLELEPGVEINKQEHIGILMWFKPSERNTLYPLFLYCSLKS
jgi:hypothetical protein